MTTQGREMRKLPEPDHGYYDGHDDFGVPIRLEFFNRNQVLYIQKQAYEDGLIDAISRLAESSADVEEMFAKIHAAKSFELDSVRKSFAAAMSKSA
jgi:hypothetical protein